MVVRVVKLPDVGEGVAEAEIVEWHVEVGDDIAEDQLLAAVMTDKATVEIPSPVAGRIVERGPDIGTRLAVGSKLVAIEPAGTGAHTEPPAVPAQPVPSPIAAAPERAEPARPPPAAPPVAPRDRPTTPAAPSTRARAETGSAKPLAAPSVRRRALELGIDLRLVPAGKEDGRIRHEDLDAYLAGDHGKRIHGNTRRADEQVRVIGMRRRIAERMAQSTRRIAHFSYIEEVDMTAVEELRGHLNARHGAERGKLTVLPFVVRAVAVAVDGFPQMNATYDDEAEVVTRHGAVHAGIATQTPAGLLVPVLADVRSLDLWQAASEIRRLAQAARDGVATREELSGSTITITSLGELGGIATTPVINWPEVAIVGVNRMAIRPVWRDNQFVPRQMMNLSSSFDHRVVDGHDAARFVRRIKELLELPATLFIGN